MWFLKTFFTGCSGACAQIVPFEVVLSRCSFIEIIQPLTSDHTSLWFSVVFNALKVWYYASKTSRPTRAISSPHPLLSGAIKPRVGFFLFNCRREKRRTVENNEKYGPNGDKCVHPLILPSFVWFFIYSVSDKKPTPYSRGRAWITNTTGVHSVLVIIAFDLRFHDRNTCVSNADRRQCNSVKLLCCSFRRIAFSSTKSSYYLKIMCAGGGDPVRRAHGFLFESAARWRCRYTFCGRIARPGSGAFARQIGIWAKTKISSPFSPTTTIGYVKRVRNIVDVYTEKLRSTFGVPSVYVCVVRKGKGLSTVKQRKNAVRRSMRIPCVKFFFFFCRFNGLLPRRTKRRRVSGDGRRRRRRQRRSEIWRGGGGGGGGCACAWRGGAPP